VLHFNRLLKKASLVLLCSLLQACLPLRQSQLPAQQTPSPPLSSGATRITAPAASSMLAQGCFGCHGPQGASSGPATPNIAGLPADYFIKVMRAYQQGERIATVMGRIARGYSSQEIARMAGYFAALPRRSTRLQGVDWVAVRFGQRLHSRYCGECHDSQDKGAPRLQGQHSAYLRWTLHDYVLGANRTGNGMQRQLTRLIRAEGKAGLEALLAYYSADLSIPEASLSR
jgi:sulfide dehydrogenase cytochrome subunit